jgi:hypothetical protein
MTITVDSESMGGPHQASTGAHKSSVGTPNPRSDLKDYCRELAEQVRTESLSRWSMQQMLKAKFPQCSDAEVVLYMQEALSWTLNEGGEL